MEAVMSDAQLVVQVWKNNSDAFGELAIKYQKPLFKVIGGLINDYEDIQDCAQDALVKTYIAMRDRKVPDDPSKFWSFLKQVARNTVIDLYRRRGMHRERMEELAETLVSIDDPIRNMELQETIDILPKNERTVIQMYYIEGYGVDEIAEKLNYKQPWVSKRKKRGEKLLGKSLGRMQGGASE